MFDSIKHLLGHRPAQGHRLQAPNALDGGLFTEADRAAAQHLWELRTGSYQAVEQAERDRRRAADRAYEQGIIALAKKAFGESGTKTRGRFHGVPGVFEIIIRNTSYGHSTNLGPALELELFFFPLLHDGNAVRSVSESVRLETGDIEHCTAWPDGVPWPGKALYDQIRNVGRTLQADAGGVTREKGGNAFWAVPT